MSQYGEPWEVESYGDWENYIQADSRSVCSVGGEVGGIFDDYLGNPREFSQRICACVNFCRGVPTEKLVGMELRAADYESEPVVILARKVEQA